MWRPAARRRPQIRIAVVPIACALAFAGCGKSGPRHDPAQEARAVAELNAYCIRLSALPAASGGSAKLAAASQRRVASLLKAVERTAAYLPAGRNLQEAHAARRALFTEASRRNREGQSRPTDFDARFDRLQLRIYRDELALGLTCAGGVARAAHETAHALATSAQ